MKSHTEFQINVAGLAQCGRALDCRAGGRSFDSWGQTNT